MPTRFRPRPLSLNDLVIPIDWLQVRTTRASKWPAPSPPGPVAQSNQASRHFPEPNVPVGDTCNVLILLVVSVLEAPLRALPGRAPARPVWHCSLRLAPGDRMLDDETWARIATEFMTALKLDGPVGVHWVAVRHADDHIHLAAILARTDGRPERASFDGLRSRAAAITIEARYGLSATAPADRTAPRAASSAEQRKAARLGQPDTARGRLLREVRAAAAGAIDEHAFLAALDGPTLV